jgi:hypothetical protein
VSIKYKFHSWYKYVIREVHASSPRSIKTSSIVYINKYYRCRKVHLVTIGCTNNDEKYKNLFLGSAEFPQSAIK